MLGQIKNTLTKLGQWSAEDLQAGKETQELERMKLESTKNHEEIKNETVTMNMRMKDMESETVKIIQQKGMEDRDMKRIAKEVFKESTVKIQSTKTR